MPDVRAIARAAAPAVMPLAYLALTLSVFWHAWTPIEGARFFWRGDAGASHVADLEVLRRALAEGRMPLWNAFDRGGVPVAGDLLAGLLYPLNWLLVALVAPVFGGVDLVEAKAVLHWVLGAAGVHLLLRHRGVAEPACYAGGLIFAFSSPIVLRGAEPLIWGAMWLPYVLLAADALARGPKLRLAALLGTAWAMVFLAGAPALFVSALLLAIPYLLVAMWGRLSASWPALVASLVVAALWILPAWVSAVETHALAVGPPAVHEAVAGDSLRMSHIFGLVAPGVGGAPLYYGWLPLAALGVAAAGARDRRAVTLACVAVAALVLSIAGGSMSAQAPAPFDLYRLAQLELILVSAAVAVAAGIGVGYLVDVRDDGRRVALDRWLTRTGGAITAALGVAVAVSIGLGEAGESARAGLTWGLVAAAGATALSRALASASERGRIACAWAAVAFLFFDLWGASVHARRDRLGPVPDPSRDEVVAELEGVGDLRYRIHDDGVLASRPGSRLEVRDFGGRAGDPLTSPRYALYRDAALEEPALWGHANVRYVLAGKDSELDRDSMIRKRRGVYELEQVAPAVYYIPRPARVSGPEQAVAELASRAPGEHAAVEGEVPEGPEGGPAVEGRVTQRSSGRLVAEITTPGPGLVIVAEAHAPAWSARVGGEPVELLWANGLFRGVPIAAAGHHVIEMRYAPTAFWATLPAHAAAAAIALWAAGAGLWRRGRRREPD